MPDHQRHEADRRQRRRARRLGCQDGSIEPGNFFGEVGLADYHDLADRVSPEVQAQMDEITEGVLSGDIPTGYEP